MEDNEQMAMPSHTDVARGAAKPTWGPDPCYIPPEAREPVRTPADGLIASATDLGITPQQSDGVRKWSRGEVGLSDAQLAALDREQRSAGVDELRRLWGADYGKNLQEVTSYLDSLPGGAGDVFRVARDGTGRALANDPEALQRALGAARARGTFMLPQGTTADKIAAIEAHMRSNRPAYDRDNALHATYRELLLARERGQ